MKKTRVLVVAVVALALLMAGTSMVAFAASDSKPSRAIRAVASSDSGFGEREGKERSFNKDGSHVNVIKIAASVLGQTEDDVKAAVKTGKVGDLLISAGKVDEFKTAYLTELKSKLDAAVSAGTLTQEGADEKYASGKEKMDAYDGTTHLCGGSDHSKMFEKKGNQKSDGGSETATTAT